MTVLIKRQDTSYTALIYREEDFDPSWSDCDTHFAHVHVLRLAAEDFARDGVTLTLGVFDRAAYDTWRGTQPDTTQVRAAWAASFSGPRYVFAPRPKNTSLSAPIILVPEDDPSGEQIIISPPVGI